MDNNRDIYIDMLYWLTTIEQTTAVQELKAQVIETLRKENVAL